MAQTFTFELEGGGQAPDSDRDVAPGAAGAAGGGSGGALLPLALRDLAKLDTCVTVVDAASFWGQLASVEVCFFFFFPGFFAHWGDFASL